MLSDRERETLLEIEHGLLDEDPRLVQTFAAMSRRARRRPRRWLLMAAIAVSALLTVLALVVDASGSALACAGLTAAAVTAWRRFEGDGAWPKRIGSAGPATHDVG